LVANTFANKNFKALNQSIMTQVNKILEDKQKLISRTQIKRTKYKILGKRVHPTEDTEATVADALNKNNVRDPEIFDDTDFYQQLLKDLIETNASNDPVAMSRKWLEGQKSKVKAHKNVDRRASKGRKIRYQVHEKLVNFMPPVPKEIPQMAEELFLKLFQD